MCELHEKIVYFMKTLLSERHMHGVYKYLLTLHAIQLAPRIQGYNINMYSQEKYKYIFSSSSYY